MNILDFSRDSALIDRELGFAIDDIELSLIKRAQALAQSNDVYSLGKVLHQGHQTWVGLDPQVLQTPYGELLEICQHLKLSSDSHIIDIGAGYGRLGFVLQQVSPQSKFTGYEFVKERVVEGNRVLQLHGCQNAMLFEQDILHENFMLPHTQYYFIYDFGFPPQIRKILQQLEIIGTHHNIMVVARGKGIRSQIHHEHLWLCGAFTPLHLENLSIYSNYYDFIEKNTPRD